MCKMRKLSHTVFPQTPQTSFVLTLTRMGENYIGLFSHIKQILKHTFENCRVLSPKTTCTQMWDGTFICCFNEISELQD